jgi:mRNA-degrading endonuclease toxin of MazEF toxin-antitoxin module
LVISSSTYNRERKEVVVAAITSNVRRRLLGDHLIVDWKGAGLLFPLVATAILRTVTRGMMDRKLGAMARVTQ